jgi:signal transduction histidine kinase
LVDDLLTLSQIEAGAVTTRPEITDVADATTEAVRMTGAEAQVVVEPGLAARIDRLHLERMLINLLTNAVRYGRPPIRVDAGRRVDVVEIRVSDAGDGVPEDFIPRLFDRFARVSSTKAESTGLGLSIVRGLAIAHGGDAFYTTTEHGGAVFGLALPAVDGQTP